MKQISLPSKTIYDIDIPDVENFNANFVYNFFVNDEEINDKGFAISERNSERSTPIFLSKIPRFVKLSWRSIPFKNAKESKPKLAQNTSLIKNNIGKIIQEDNISLLNFTGINFQDGDINEKVHHIISGTIGIHSLGKRSIPTQESEITSFLKSEISLSKTEELLDVFFSKHKDNMGLLYEENKDMLSSSDSDNLTNEESYSDLSKVKLNLFVNSKLLSEISRNCIFDPFSSYGNDLIDILNESSNYANIFDEKAFSSIDYFATLPFVEKSCSKNAYTATDSFESNTVDEIVGYIIDKKQHLANGTIIEHEPIVIGNYTISEYIDTQVKYGKTYSYSIRTISKITIPAFDDTSGSIVQIKSLFSSKSSHREYVNLVEKKAPKPPFDFNFAWNYKDSSLMLYWSFPTNSQRDIKKFQVFRRETIDHPFELIREIDFNDSLTPYASIEKINNSLVKKVDEPITYFVDEDFTKTSKYIYSVASIDAHGYSSNYSDQFEIYFDIYKNSIVKKLISHSGAPKQYPNMYVPEKCFVEAANASGKKSKRMFLFFTPECYQVKIGETRDKLMSMKSDNGLYKIQFINTDNQKSQTLKIVINDDSKN